MGFKERFLGLEPQEFRYKTKAYLRRKLIVSQLNKPWYNGLYGSYWHMLIHKENGGKDQDFYIASRPNPGAGIGHQMSNWLCGHKMSNYYGIGYAVYPFSYLKDPFVPNDWDRFLGLNENMVKAEDLYAKGYKKVILPRVDWYKEKDHEFLWKIMNSYSGKVVFLLEMDQFINDELEDLEYLREKYYACPERKNDRLVYNKDHFNVAVHIRRGDIVQKDPNHLREEMTKRWLDTSYYVDLLRKYVPQYAGNNEVDIYLFSQAAKEELGGFEEFGNVHFCNDYSAIESFLHMANADLFIMSKSGMSYQAAKLNLNGVILYPKGFWNEPVDSDRWIVIDQERN